MTRSPLWHVHRRPYTGVEDSFITPGCRKVTTKHGFVILIVAENRLHAELATGGAIYRGRRTRDFHADGVVDWKKQGKSFVRACADYERNT